MKNPLIIFQILFLIALTLFVGSFVIQKIRRRYEKPTDFAAGIARSLRERPQLWDYDDNENWIHSNDAHLSISVYGESSATCNSWLLSNHSSRRIVEFKGADFRAFKAGYQAWKELTSIDRMHTAEKRKREALAVLVA